MKLQPSLKQKKRYVLFEIKSKDKFGASEVKKEVDAALLLFIGQLGLSKASPLFLKERYKDNQFMVKINHKHVDECISAIMLIKTIKNKPVLIRSVITSGTLKKVS